jgi:hypothetical protein
MLGAAVVRRASIGVLLADLDPMFLDGIALRMLEVALSQGVDVASVTNGRRVDVPSLTPLCLAWSVHHVFPATGTLGARTATPVLDPRP